MKYIRVGFLLAAASLSTNLVAGESSANDLYYRIDADFTFLDDLKGADGGFIRPDKQGPTFEAGSFHAGQLPAKAKPARSLGLSRLEVGLIFRLGNNSSFSMNLRPDANSSESKEDYKGFDSRAGESYRPNTNVELLDSYAVTMFLGPSINVQLGVFESIATQDFAYRSPIEFGLNVRLPTRFSAIKLNGSFRKSDPESGDNTEYGFDSELMALQGENDRVESLGAGDRHFDQAPMSKDPYSGLAWLGSWQPNSKFQVKSLLGFLESAAEPTGILSESFGSLTIGFQSMIARFRSRTVASFRYSKEKWRSDDIEPESLTQQSAGISTSLTVGAESSFNLALQTGRSERHKDSVLSDGTTVTGGSVNPHSGSQVEFGFRGRLTEGLFGSVFVAQEQRVREDDDGEEVGAFSNDVERKKTIKRLAIGINYSMDGNR